MRMQNRGLYRAPGCLLITVHHVPISLVPSHGAADQDFLVDSHTDCSKHTRYEHKFLIRIHFGSPIGRKYNEPTRISIRYCFSGVAILYCFERGGANSDRIERGVICSNFCANGPHNKYCVSGFQFWSRLTLCVQAVLSRI